MFQALATALGPTQSRSYRCICSKPVFLRNYLHMADTVDTAVSVDIDADTVDLESEPFTMAELWQPEDPNVGQSLRFLNSRVRLTNVLNELTRSMGQPDDYPFAMPREAIRKLQFIHEVIRSASALPLAAPSVTDDAVFANTTPQPEAANV